MLALTGSPVNLLVSDARREYGGRAVRVLRVRAGRRPAAARDDRRRRPARRAAPARRARPQTISRDLSRARPDARATQYGLDDEAPRRLARAASSGLAEVVIPPRSPFVGERVFPGMITDRRRPRRRGHPAARARTSATGEVELAAGDVLLLQGTWEALDDERRRPGRPRRRPPGARPPPGRPARPAAPGRRSPSWPAMVVLLVTGRRPAGRRGPARRGRADRPAGRHDRAARTGRSPGRRSSSSPAMLPLSTAMFESGRGRPGRRAPRRRRRRARAVRAAGRPVRRHGASSDSSSATWRPR